MPDIYFLIIQLILERCTDCFEESPRILISELSQEQRRMFSANLISWMSSRLQGWGSGLDLLAPALRHPVEWEKQVTQGHFDHCSRATAEGSGTFWDGVVEKEQKKSSAHT